MITIKNDPYATDDVPTKNYIRDINLGERALRPALLLRRLPNSRIEIIYTDTGEVSRLAPRRRYAVRRGIDLAGTPEMTYRVNDEPLEIFAKILVVSPIHGDNRKTLERWVTVDDYEASLPQWGDNQ